MSRRIRKLIDLFRSHREIWWIIIYTTIYMVGFKIMENAGHVHYHVIHTWLDDQIPFCEYFIVPYMMWFVYNVSVVAWFDLKADKREYYRLITALMLGMTAFLVLSVAYPNKLELRPEYVDTSSIFGKMVQALYLSDTPTNVLPSIHVYNTVVVNFAINANKTMRKHKAVLIGFNVLAVLIILSTMFLKQHSVIDVSMGLVLGVLMQIVSDRIFETEEERALAKETAYGHASSSRRAIN